MPFFSSQKKLLLKISTLSCCITLITSCAKTPPNTFTFTADLPPEFAYKAIAEYVPAKGETCSVPGGRNTAVGYNMKWRESYTPNSEIAIYRTVSGCPLVIRRIKLDINASYWTHRGDFGGDSAMVIVRDDLEEEYKGTFSDAGESTFYGHCQWLFRTSGAQRRIVKILDCKTANARGEPQRGHPVSGYSLDQLQGKTVKMKITLAAEERPGWGDTWVEVPGGWKRCMGNGFEDQRAYCNGNYKDFSTFTWPDGRICTIYPGCTE
ncbi:hypothetical protein [Pseudomonas fluorescens]|uniref:Lipoprotein n=1 Tax=Pseudomonas fluorescens TaxID=294 RepID=A0A5E7AUB8_PSEFL|nr:hypothetical protein [Pseudomonas fluorescens]VVN82978.1 hypothetical protein PS704_01242 [Pseudomonas fluorescens]